MAAVAVMAIALAGAFRAGRVALELTRQARLRFAATEAAQNGLAQIRFKLATQAALPSSGKLDAAIVGPYPDIKGSYRIEKVGGAKQISVSCSWGTAKKPHQVILRSFDAGAL
jgi:hypothetical protein